MIKITYNISKSVDIEPFHIIPRINNKLLGLGYTIISEDKEAISFKDDIWQFGSRAKAFSKVDGGKFKVVRLKNETKIVLSYYVSFDFVIYFAVFFALLSLVFDYRALYLLLVFIVIHLLRIDNVKSLGKEMINTILL